MWCVSALPSLQLLPGGSRPAAPSRRDRPCTTLPRSRFPAPSPELQSSVPGTPPRPHLLEAVEPSPCPQVDDVEPGAAGAEHGGAVAADLGAREGAGSGAAPGGAARPRRRGTAHPYLHAAAGVEGLHPPGHSVAGRERGEEERAVGPGRHGEAPCQAPLPPARRSLALEAQGPGRRHAAGLPRAARRKASLPARGGDVLRAKEAGSAMAATGGAAPPDRAASKRPTRPRNVPGVLPPPPREPPGLFGLRKVQIRGLQYELEQLNLY